MTAQHTPRHAPASRQMGLFEPYRDAIALSYQEWRAKNPQVYAALCEVAREIAADEDRFGMKAVAEIARYKYRHLKGDQSYAVNNSYLSLAARDMEREGVVRPGFFEKRALMAERLERATTGRTATPQAGRRPS